MLAQIKINETGIINMVQYYLNKEYFKQPVEVKSCKAAEDENGYNTTDDFIIIYNDEVIMVPE